MVTVTGIAQRESWAGDGLPPVEAIAPGLWSFPVPIPQNPIRYVLCYGLVAGSGIVLIDPGWNAEESYRRLRDGLAQAGFAIADVVGVVVTHFHPDHYGLAARIRAESGAWLALHAADAAVLEHRRSGAARDLLAKQLAGVGVPAEEQEALELGLAAIAPFTTLPAPDRLIADGEYVDAPGWRLRAIWTPGHSPGHVCFYEERLGLLFAGDHVLPSISPNVSYLPGMRADPLGDFVASLRKIAALGEPREVLPAHEWRFRGLGARVGDLIAHHEQRSAELLGILAAGPATLWEISERLTWSVPRAELRGATRRAALAEAMAHLVYLERQGHVVADGDDPVRYQLCRY